MRGGGQLTKEGKIQRRRKRKAKEIREELD
jgi:hypothetical protein